MVLWKWEILYGKGKWFLKMGNESGKWKVYSGNGRKWEMVCKWEMVWEMVSETPLDYPYLRLNTDVTSDFRRHVRF